MQASDIMTTNVVTVGPETTIEQAAQMMLDHHISGMPVVDDANAVVGMISEGDLLHRAEINTERKRAWWLRIFANPADDARDFVREHGRTVKTVMTGNAITVEETAPLADIAEILEEKRIKRVPVVSGGKLVGIVSRANLLRALASHRKDGPSAPSTDDRSLRQAVTKALESKDWASHGAMNVIVTDGVVELWGWVESDDERKALCVAAQEVPGVKRVIDHLGAVPPYLHGT